MRFQHLFTWAIYFAALAVIIVASIVAAIVAIPVDRFLSGMEGPGWLGSATDYLAPFVGGSLVALALIAGVIRWKRFLSTPADHVFRTLSWYALAAGLAGFLLFDDELGIWFFLFRWSLFGTLGAIATDLFVTLRRRHRREAQAIVLLQ